MEFIATKKPAAYHQRSCRAKVNLVAHNTIWVF